MCKTPDYLTTEFPKKQNTMKNKTIRNWMLTLFILSYPISLFADDDIDPHPSDDDPLPGAPIDTALIYLIIIGLLFAFFIIQQRKQFKKSN